MYNFLKRKPIVKSKERTPPVNAGDIVLTKYFDFSQITKVRTIRRLNQPEKFIATLTLHFLLDLAAIQRLQSHVGKDASILDIRLVNSANMPRAAATIVAAAINFSHFVPKEPTDGIQPVSLDLEVDSTKVKPPGYDLYQPGDFGNVAQDLEFVFTILRSSGEEGDKIGPPIPGVSFSKPYDMDEDLDAYYIARHPVKITAAATSYDQTLVTLYKSSACNAESADIFRRGISPDGELGEFQFVTNVDFSGENDTLIDESYTVSFVDGNPTSNPDVPFGVIDNTFAYQYRAIPIGQRKAPSYVYRDSFTTPITQASVSIGDNFRILPVFARGVHPRNGAADVIGYQLTDDNFLSPSAPMVKTTSDLAIVSYRAPDTVGGITVVVSGRKNSETPAAIDFVRRDLSKNERRFTLISTVTNSTQNSRRMIPGALQEGERFTLSCDDTNVVDGHTYEYAVRTHTRSGITQLSEDKTNATYFDPRLLGSEDLNLEITSSPSLDDRGNAVIDFDVFVPQNVISLLESLLNNRIGDRESPFAQDIIKQRRNLSPQPAPVIRRLNLATGEEVSFKLMGSTARMFDLTSSGNANTVQNRFSYRFTDDSVSPGGEYQYEVLVNLRDPLSVTDEITSVVERTRQPYMFQSCKMHNPLFIKRGILPPTERAQNKILQRNINSGRDRLLNLLTPADTWDLGRTNLHSLVPNSPLVIPETGTAVSDAKVQTTKIGEATVTWSIKGRNSAIDHFRVFAIDAYEDNERNQLIKKSWVANIPAQLGYNFIVASKMSRLKEEDRRQFTIPTHMTIDILDLQRLVDLHEVSVSRSYQIVTVNSKGSISNVSETEKTEIWSSRLRRFNTNSGRELKFVTPPANVFEGKEAPGKGMPIQDQAREFAEARPREGGNKGINNNMAQFDNYVAGQNNNGMRDGAPYAQDNRNIDNRRQDNRNAKLDQNAPRFGANLPGMNQTPPVDDQNKRGGPQVSPGELDKNKNGGQKVQAGNFRWGG